MSHALGAGAGVERFQVPLHSKKPEEGSITYLFDKQSLDNTGGLFSFTFYVGDDVANGLLYILGIYIYTQILKSKPFSNWKILIYTDAYSYKKLMEYPTKEISEEVSANLPNYKKYVAKESINRQTQAQAYLRLVMENPNVLFAIVDWPSQQRQKEVARINGSALRPFRSRAPFDFPDKLIFIRDADTLFQETLSNVMSSLIKQPTNKEETVDSLAIAIEGITDWEQAFLNEIPTITAVVGKPPLIVGAGTISRYRAPYLKDWHANELLQKKAPFGIFAGFVNVVPGIPMYQTADAWDEFIEYQDKRSYPIGNISEFQLKHGLKTPEEIDPKIQELLKVQVNRGKRLRFSEASIARTVKTMEESYLTSKHTLLKNAFSNNMRAEKIGRDEQLYLFLFLPKLLDHVYFYKINLSGYLEKHKANQNFHTQTKVNYERDLKQNFQVKKGGKRTRKKLRLKFEKRKTRKSRE